nr:alpha/beta hydrolase [Pleionea sp. CnH1-48]
MISSPLYAKDGFFDSKGTNIHYVDEGAGTPIVLIHGFSMDLKMWYDTGIIQKLAKNHRVIALDCRGHGKSDKPQNPSDYGPKVGEDVVRLLDHLKIEKTHLVGYSMGAFVVGRLLVSHPERVMTATLGSGYFPVKNKEEEAYAEEMALTMEERAQKKNERTELLALAAVARGWKYDAVTDQQVAAITVPVQAVFGSEERNDFFESQKARLELPKSSLPIIIVEGADHDSEKAAVLRPEFLQAVKNIIRLKESSK